MFIFFMFKDFLPNKAFHFGIYIHVDGMICLQMPDIEGPHLLHCQILGLSFI